MTKKINKEKSVVFSKWNDTVSLNIKGTFVDNFDYPNSYFEGTLCGIRKGTEKPFSDSYGIWYKYFVPRSTMVLEEEYKPFTKMEQLAKKDLYMGESFFIRSKDNPEITHLVRITEISLNSKEHIVCIGLGVSAFSPEELLNNYEWCRYLNRNWQPFGVKDE